MNKAVRIFFLIVVFASAAYAEDVAKDFTFETIEGKTINYKAATGMPMVINIGSHW